MYLAFGIEETKAALARTIVLIASLKLLLASEGS